MKNYSQLTSLFTFEIIIFTILILLHKHFYSSNQTPFIIKFIVRFRKSNPFLQCTHFLLTALLPVVVFFLTTVFKADGFDLEAVFFATVLDPAFFVTCVLVAVFLTNLLLPTGLLVTETANVLLFLSFVGFSGPPNWLTAFYVHCSLLSLLWFSLMISLRFSRVSLCFLAKASRALSNVSQYFTYSFLIFYCSFYSNWLKVGRFFYLRALSM